MDEELRLHLEMQTQANRQSGMPPEEARYAALRQLGHLDGIKETARDQRGWIWLETTLRDIRYSARSLGSSPVFTGVAVLSLALGIGANTLIFSLLNGLLFRSLPVQEPVELRSITWVGHNVETGNYRGSGRRETASGGRAFPVFPYATYRDFRDHGTGFDQLFAFSSLPSRRAVTPAGASMVPVLMVSGNFFKGYGADVLVGRPISTQDDRPDAPLTAVITHRWWERQFALDPAAVGQQFSLSGLNFTIVGILGPDYSGPLLGDPADVYVPMSAQPQLDPAWPLASYHHWWVEIMGRLAPGADEQQAQAVLEVLFKRTLAAPGGKTKASKTHVLLEDGSRGPLMLRERAARPVYVLLIAVALVLLVACANLASLLLARGTSRVHEYAVRTALGASRGCLIRRCLTESLLLALAGGSFGLAFCWIAKRAILPLLSSATFDFHFDLRTDLRVLAFTFGLSLVTVLLFGLVPAFRTSRIHPVSGLKDRGAVGRSPRLGTFLVTAQVAVSVVLLVGAGLILRTLINLRAVDPGFDTENLLLFDINPGEAGYSGIRLADLYQDLTQSLARIPGVSSVAFSNLAFLTGGYSAAGVKIPGRPVLMLSPGQLSVSDSFFTAMRIPILLGRELDARDTSSASQSVVVNQSFARTYFPDENPIGKIIMVGSEEYSIIGICRDSQIQDLRQAPQPAFFHAFRQTYPESVVFAVRSRVSPSSLGPAIRRAVTCLDGGIPVTGMRTQAEQIDRLLMLERLFAGLCATAGLVALLLSAIGLYGLITYTAGRRTSEIGLRMALGARRSNVIWSVIRQALIMTTAGIVVGGVTAVGVGTVLSSGLYGVRPSDPLTLLGSAALLLAVAIAAAAVPARRAARIDPLTALRVE